MCFTNLVIFVFQNPTGACLFGSSFSKTTFCGSPVAPMFVLRNKLLFYVPEGARPRALKVMEAIVYRRQKKTGQEVHNIQTLKQKLGKNVQALKGI